jgi:hypothetical protein
VGDIQGDGRPEIVFANAYDDNIFIYQNHVGDTNVAQPPVFIEQPQSQTVEAGSSVTFTVGVTGTQPFGYRWRRNGVTIENSNTDTFTDSQRATERRRDLHGGRHQSGQSSAGSGKRTRDVDRHRRNERRLQPHIDRHHP